jgi:hypothetical protein
MTDRNQQIKDAARAAYPQLVETDSFLKCFRKGAEWADANRPTTNVIEKVLDQAHERCNQWRTVSESPPAPSQDDERDAHEYALKLPAIPDGAPEAIRRGIIFRAFLAGRKGMVPASQYEAVKNGYESLKTVRAAEVERLRFDMNEYIKAYAPDFFDEPEGFTPKLDMNSAALVRTVLSKLLTPKEGEGG